MLEITAYNNNMSFKIMCSEGYVLYSLYFFDDLEFTNTFIKEVKIS